MKTGAIGIIAALAVASVLTLVSSGAIFVAQRLGPAQALPQIGLGDNCPAGSICYPAEIGWFSLTVVAGFAVLIASVLLRLALLYLLRADFVTGELLYVTGGQHLVVGKQT